MSTMASRITGASIVGATVYSGADKKETSKLRVTGLLWRNRTETSEFPSQRSVTRKMFPFDVYIIMDPHMIGP